MAVGPPRAPVGVPPRAAEEARPRVLGVPPRVLGVPPRVLEVQPRAREQGPRVQVVLPKAPEGPRVDPPRAVVPNHPNDSTGKPNRHGGWCDRTSKICRQEHEFF